MQRIATCLMLAAGLLLPRAAPATDVLTYHDDNRRTGWNPAETLLTPASVAGGFGLQTQVALDEQVDAQPLFVAGQSIAGGVYDTVYVVTENNSIYAIDANTGNVLVQQNLGPAVPVGALPGGCNNNSNNMGINSTPVIDPATNTLYVMAYTYDGGTTPTFRLHALDLGTLQDQVTPAVAAAGNTFRFGKPVAFLGANQRQRAGLLQTNGVIYAGFASWCDINNNVSRGWVLGWQTGTLAPLAANKLNNRLGKSTNDFFLSSVWMSGYGIASDDATGIYFVTGNSDPAGHSYSSSYNIAESVVNMSFDLTTMQGFFTPAGSDGWSAWDKTDADFGSGGVLLLPDQAGAAPHLAVAAGKAGPMVLLNRDNLGGLGNTHKLALGNYANGGCWCGQSYFVGGDGIGRVVSSTGGNVAVWKVQTTPRTSLVQESVSPYLNSGQDPGFFTSVSSNGTVPGTAVVWAVSRPTGGPDTVYLQAFDPANGSAAILSAPLAAGTWPFAGSANANLVPVAANGHVFVASYGNLSIFGLTGGGSARRTFRAPPVPPRAAFAGAAHDVYGTVTAIDGDTLTLRTRGGAVLQVAMGAAVAAHHAAPPSAGHGSLVRGEYAGAGRFTAQFVLHAKDDAALWPPDR